MPSLGSAAGAGLAGWAGATPGVVRVGTPGLAGGFAGLVRPPGRMTIMPGGSFAVPPVFGEMTIGGGSFCGGWADADSRPHDRARSGTSAVRMAVLLPSFPGSAGTCI